MQMCCLKGKSKSPITIFNTPPNVHSCRHPHPLKHLIHLQHPEHRNCWSFLYK